MAFTGRHLCTDRDLGWTWQVGDGGRLAGRTGIMVVNDFRSNDMKHDGEGAPLVPLYHTALLRRDNRFKTVAILNIGGVANVTWAHFDDTGHIDKVIAFDTGPGNAILDDWAEIHTGKPIDYNGELAARGITHDEVVSSMMASPYFDEEPPKTLDRDDFNHQSVRGLTAEDGAATLTDFFVETIVAAQSHFPEPPQAWYVAGGGRHNATLMRRLRRRFPVLVESVDTLGWRGDALEAEAFAYLAVRSLRNLPLTLPSTTGCVEAVSGGQHHKPVGRRPLR